MNEVPTPACGVYRYSVAMVMVVKAAPFGAVTVYVMTTSDVARAGGGEGISATPELIVVVSVTVPGTERGEL